MLALLPLPALWLHNIYEGVIHVKQRTMNCLVVRYFQLIYSKKMNLQRVLFLPMLLLFFLPSDDLWPDSIIQQISREAVDHEDILLDELFLADTNINKRKESICYPVTFLALLLSLPSVSLPSHPWTRTN